MIGWTLRNATGPQEEPSALLLFSLLRCSNNLQIAAGDTNFSGFRSALCLTTQSLLWRADTLLAAQCHEPYASGLE